MPSKRPTRAKTNRAKPKLKDDGEETSSSEVDRETKLQSYLQDCDISLEKRKKVYDSELQTLLIFYNKKFRQLKMRLSQVDREMTVKDFIASMDVEDTEHEEMDTFDEEPAFSRPTMVLNHRSALTDTVSKYTNRSRRAIETIEEEGAAPTTIKKPKGRKKASTVTFNPEPTPLSSVSSSFITPAMSRQNSALGWNTPLVTPKFDPRLPITPAQRRDAKAGEIVMSLAGSPINILSKQSIKMNKKGKTLNIEVPDEIDISEDQIQKMMTMLQNVINDGDT